MGDVHDSSVRADEAEPSTDTEATVLSVSDLHKQYEGSDGSVTAVERVDFDIERGTAVGLLGPNGAGKTTTIKSVLGLIVPTGGTVRVHGTDIHDEPERAYRHIGAMLEGARNVYWRLTVRENMRFFAALAGESTRRTERRQRELLDKFGLTDKADSTVRELSRGEKQKVSLACTLARDADVVLLDEPTLGLDVESSLELREELRRLVTDRGTTLLLSSHDMDVIEDICDRVVVMNDGEVVTDRSVSNLLDVFDIQSYRIVVDGTLPQEIRRRLSAQFDADSFETRGGSTQFSVRVGGDEFYRLVDGLREAGCDVESFTSVEPDLEEVFIQLTNEPSEGPLESDRSQRMDTQT
ncbi:ABC transporter ATP-binding protein [Haloferax denitrificans]|uniref:ABC transporter n=1 Tax=Haloferax denitrificans ATCC 35960 TaxID=662478 RepID=M0JE96_9EURY|nr:ABC transporter ATP-binding protein [Haloferax denitrificans]EMA07467.1 ABC transporter [Haloferax denitrificans ATCC 35960]